MNKESWRLRIEHDCDPALLRQAAIDRMNELRKAGADRVRVTHRFDPNANVDVVEVSWLGQKIQVLVKIENGYALVGIKIPLVLSIFETSVKDRIYNEIRQTVKEGGGKMAVFSSPDSP